ncbi:hypothetical protein D918_09023 [Trichuris suis]|nr:hypothetical protein D918_09023 [Trichuris suis]
MIHHFVTICAAVRGFEANSRTDISHQPFYEILLEHGPSDRNQRPANVDCEEDAQQRLAVGKEPWSLPNLPLDCNVRHMDQRPIGSHLLSTCPLSYHFLQSPCRLHPLYFGGQTCYAEFSSHSHSLTYRRQYTRDYAFIQSGQMCAAEQQARICVNYSSNVSSQLVNAKCAIIQANLST